MGTTPNPKVAVVIPVYNRAHILRRAIDSALAQDYEPKRVIVVDDGSTDDSLAVAQSYGDPVTALRQDNAGPDPARNRAILAAEDCEFISFLDSDDEYLPGRLSKALRPMIENPTVGLTWTLALDRFPDGTESIRGGNAERVRRFPRRFWPDGRLITSAISARRDKLIEAGLFDRPLLAFADIDLWLRVGELAETHGVMEKLTIINCEKDSRSRNKNLEKVRESYFQIIEDGFRRRPDLYEPHRATIMAEAYFAWGHNYKRVGDFAKARHNFATSLRHQYTPWALKSWLGAWLGK